uniref:DUF1758 domain-containing protein n=1 Tax=Loa loa TaxID=7209 RepID=A0A1I7V662_LOALO
MGEIQVVDIPSVMEKNHQLEGLTFYQKKTDILIGADYFLKFIQLEKIQRLNSGFSSLHTNLGPMICGSGYLEEIKQITHNPVKFKYIASVRRVPNIDQFWKLECIEIQEQPYDHDDEQALEQFKRNIIKINGRYQFRQQELEQYHEIIQEQLRSDTIEKVEPHMDKVGIIYYLPHHYVLTPDKDTTKLRVVYDASTHVKGSKSLNEVLYRGPITVPDIVGILLRFRIMTQVITTDIEKTFLQIELHPEDRNCARFLWLKDITKDVTEENL